jgi:hypothetical protein
MEGNRMSTTSPPRAYKDPEGSSLAMGVVVFAGVLLLTLASFGILQGIAAIAEDDVYLSGVNYTYEIDLTTWGWVHLALGVIAAATGLGMLYGQTWARIAGIAIASLSALANFAFLPYYPLWSLVIITFCVMVVWALTTQLREG